jgi:hypothetical protein
LHSPERSAGVRRISPGIIAAGGQFGVQVLVAGFAG